MGDINLAATELKDNYQMKCDGHKMWIVNVSEKPKQIKPVEQRSYMNIWKMRENLTGYKFPNTDRMVNWCDNWDSNLNALKYGCACSRLML